MPRHGVEEGGGHPPCFLEENRPSRKHRKATPRALIAAQVFSARGCAECQDYTNHLFLSPNNLMRRV